MQRISFLAAKHHCLLYLIIVIIIIIITRRSSLSSSSSSSSSLTLNILIVMTAPAEYPLTTLKILLLISWSNSHIKIYTCNKLQHPCWYHQFYFRCKKPKVILTKVPAQKFLNIGKIYMCQEFLLCIKSMLCVKIFFCFYKIHFVLCNVDNSGS